MHNEYVLGVDGGGTKTLVAIAKKSGEIIGTGLGASANIDDVGVETAQANIGMAFSAACRMAGLAEGYFAATFFGMAGVISDRDRTIIRQIAVRLGMAEEEKVDIDHDCRIALAAGLSGRPGVVLITGTGSSCYGRAKDGQDWRAGGWGQLISDEGSSYWLGVQAMRTSVMVHDGRLASSLLPVRVMEHLGLKEMNDILHCIYIQGLTRSEIAVLGQLVIQAARDGDQVSLDLIKQGTRDLAICVSAVADRLGFGQSVCEVALTGGLLNAGEIFINPLKQAIAKRLPHTSIIQAEHPPVAGACLLALQNLGITVDAKMIEMLGNSRVLFT